MTCPCDCHAGGYAIIPCSIPGGCAAHHDRSCVACHRHPARFGYVACHACVRRTTLALSPGWLGDPQRPPSIPVLYSRLDPIPPVTDHQRRRTGWSAPSPADEHILAMRDPRTRADDTDHRPPRCAVAELGALARSIAAERGHRPPPTDLEAVCRWLCGQLGWLATRQRFAPDSHTIQQLHSDLRTATGDPPPRPIARCIRVTVDGTCAAPIYLPHGADIPRDADIHELPRLRCRDGHEYVGLDVLRLRIAQEAT